MHKFIGLFILAMAIGSSVHAESPLKCAFENTAVMGASISGNTWSNPLNLEFIARNKARKAKDKSWIFKNGLSPGDMLSLIHADKVPTARFASYISPIQTGLSYAYDYLTKADQALVTALNNSTSVVGVDLFYFSAGFNECQEYGDEQVTRIIGSFIRALTNQKKVVILGTVPQENEAYLLYPTSLFGQQIMALPSQQAGDEVESCRKTINASIIEYCRADQGCYIVHLDTIVAGLNRTKNGSFPMPSLTREATEKVDALDIRSRDEIRPDGLNISAEGSRLMYESIVRQMQRDLPACAR